jgi:hypothetical protein
MHQSNHTAKPEYRLALGKVLHYINQNLAGDVSLETPKQYVIRLRMEQAARRIGQMTVEGGQYIHIESMGYAISQMICYEEFEGNQVERPYGSGSRTLLLPVRTRE